MAKEPATRRGLTRERVLRAAMRLADQGGLEAISMRRLGQALGVEAMSLYAHVRNKDEILDGIADLVVQGFELPRPGRAWRPELRRTAISGHEALTAHPWACALIMSPDRDVPAQIPYMESVLGCLRGAGFPARIAYSAYHAVDAHILGFSMWEAGHSPSGGRDLTAVAGDFLDSLPEGAYPFLTEHVRGHLAGRGPDGSKEFAFVLDLILDGLARRLPRRRGQPGT